MADQFGKMPPNPLGGSNNQAQGSKKKWQANVVGNAHEQPPPGNQEDMVQVDGNNMQLKFNMPGQNKKAVTIEEFKKLCGSSPRLYDVMKYKGK